MNTENNKLIALFMGGKLNNQSTLRLAHHEIWLPIHGICRYDTIEIGKGKILKYHTSWDWLMSVVEKIEAIQWENTPAFSCWSSQPFTLRIEGQNAEIIIDGGSIPRDPIHKTFPVQPIDFKGKSKLEITYLMVVDFIKWYNQQTS